MGWSSWNHFKIDIDEALILQQADAMVASGMKDAGYEYINIDDGFFGGRNEEGVLLHHPEKFPNGMKFISNYIHAKGLKAGIYTDAGHNTCASGEHAQNDVYGIGAGLYGYDQQDLTQFLVDWNYDFIKVDWCGGRDYPLDAQQRYTEIGQHIRQIKPEAVYNICKWEFPGTWALDVADSWRTSGDILPHFPIILSIIERNADLWMHAGPGQVNDMDMLQVGRGMSYEQDKSHFTMWAIMTSPLLAGNDLRNMSKETLEILTNKEVIALNQDPLVYQARRLRDEGHLELWAKPLEAVDSGKVGVVLFNRSGSVKEMTLSLSHIGIDPSKGYIARDLWRHRDLPGTHDQTITVTIPGHGVVALRVEGKEDQANNPFRPENVDTYQIVKQNFFHTLRDYLFVYSRAAFYNIREFGI